MKNHLSILVFLSIGLISCHTTKQQQVRAARKNPNSLSMQLSNGYWFNGQTFEQKTVWVREGILTFKKSKVSPDTVIDLSVQYVIPPFGEAHNHNLESSYKLDKRIGAYLDNGVYYVKLLSSMKKRIDPLMHRYNKPDGIDISMAHAPLTGTGGHPVALRKRFWGYGRFEGLFNSFGEIESHGFFILDDLSDLENKWEQILSFQPDFLKIMLLYSEEYNRRKDDTTYFGNKGLNPKLVPKIVKKAHEQNLRVSAHVETAHDFRVAVQSGVDEIAHLPEIDNGALIDRQDAMLAKKKDVVVTTTISLITKKQKEDNYQKLLANIYANLKILKDAGVKLAIGSDLYNDNSVGEFQLLYDSKLFTNLELLKMWCENSALTTFPNRKIAYLREGYEANFLVLNRNPLEEMNAINESIVLRIKQGQLLE